MNGLKKYWIAIIIILFAAKAFPLPTGINTGNISIDMTLDGKIRLYQPNFTGAENLYSLSILVGTSPSTVFDYWQDSGIQDSTRAYYDSLTATLGLYGSFNNSLSNRPPNVLIKTNVTAWNGSTYALIKYVIINREVSNRNALIGLEIVPQVDGIIGFDTVKYFDTTSIIDIYKNNHLGFKLLNGKLKSLTSFEYFDGYQNDSSFYKWMTHDTLDTLYNSGPDGPVSITSQDFQNINPGDSITVFYGLALEASYPAVKSGLDSAFAKFRDSVLAVSKENNVAPDYKLYQNYPNPFNPSTTISFSIPKQEKVSLKVYNILGMEVADLINNVQAAGKYSIIFNSKNLSSGIYFYELRTEDFRDVRKMILLK